MLDDAHESFYDIDYETAYLGNKCPWATLALYTVPDPAIVFPPCRYNIFQKAKAAIEFLLSIESRHECISMQNT